MIKGFKEFITRGNVVDLAVGIVIGAAFTAVVNAFVANLINPLIALILGNNAEGIDGLTLGIGEQDFLYGLFLSAVITFVLTAAAVYFAVVAPMNHFKQRRQRGEEPAPPSDEELRHAEIMGVLREIASQGT